MSFKPLLRLARDGRLSALLGVGAGLKPFYKLTFLGAAGSSGVLARLSSGPASFDALAEFLGVAGPGREALEAWLQMGVRLKLLNLDRRGYSLRGLARLLVRPENDAALAMVEEVAGLHHKLIAETLPKIRRGELWTLADQDGTLIARSSRVLEDFQAEAIRRTFPSHGSLRLLEIGCGSGIYLRYAANHNPNLTAVGVELQPEVAEVARTNLQGWGVADRVRVEDGDIRAQHPGDPFDIATLYNNVYYVPVHERVELFQHIARFLRPGGFLLVTTLCQGGSVGAEALNLWSAATRGAGRLPGESELVDQLRSAGYPKVTTINLLPGDRFVAFHAVRG